MSAISQLVVDGVGMDFAARGSSFTALDGVSFHAEEGSFTTLLGPSGCGKSTLLRIISDILQPTRGRVEIFGRTPGEARRAGDFGFVFQDPVLLPWRSALGNVALTLEARKVPRGERLDRAMALLDLVGLGGFEHHLPAKLSGGMARRVATARALVMQPRTLFLDEPFNGLDELRREQMNDELQRIVIETGTTAVLVTHDVAEAVYLSDTVVVLGSHPGHVVEHRPIDLPRPRTIGMTTEPAFLEHVTALSGLLRSAYVGVEDA